VDCSLIMRPMRLGKSRCRKDTKKRNWKAATKSFQCNFQIILIDLFSSMLVFDSREWQMSYELFAILWSTRCSYFGINYEDAVLNKFNLLCHPSDQILWFIFFWLIGMLANRKRSFIECFNLSKPQCNLNCYFVVSPYHREVL
jgi:hypothetical protein